MHVGDKEHTYTWDSNWAKLPQGITLGYTHGVIVDREGFVYVFNQSRHAVLKFDKNGNFVSTWQEFPSNRFLGAHGMTLTQENGEQFLWLTDQETCEVVKTTLDGRTLLNIERPDHPAYNSDACYCPTWATQSPMDGIIFVADGYGTSWISRYDKNGKLIDAFDGSEGAGPFNCPHAVAILSRPLATGTNDPVLYVTDRGNSRVQIFDLDCRFIKSFEQQRPCTFAESSGHLIVPDLHAAVMIYDEKDELITTLGENLAVPEDQANNGWPNIAHELREDGKFNSPHSAVADEDGNIYVVEWIEDGRITKLTYHT